MKNPLLILCAAFALAFSSTASAQAPVQTGRYYQLWSNLSFGWGALGKDKSQSFSYVHVDEVKGDWVRVTLYRSVETLSEAMVVDELKHDTEIGKSILAAAKSSKEEVLKKIEDSHAKDMPGLPRAQEDVWVNFTQVAAVKELPRELAKTDESKK